MEYRKKTHEAERKKKKISKIFKRTLFFFIKIPGYIEMGENVIF